MISYWDSWLPTAKYHEAPAEEQSKLVAYRRHVANGTVPESGIPYTLTGVEAYRHKSSIEEYKPGMILPTHLFTEIGADLRTAASFPGYRHQDNMASYQKEFDRLNGLRSL